MLEAFPLAVLEIDPDGIVVDENPKSIEIFGRGNVGRHYVAVIRQPELISTISESLSDGEGRETKYVDNSPTGYRRFAVHIMPTNQKSLLISFQDLSSVDQLAKVRRDFIADVSHELKTPLTAINGLIETLSGPAGRDAALVSRFAGLMQTEAERMQELIGDLLTLSEVESQQTLLPDLVVNPTELAELLTSRFTLLPNPKQVSFVINFEKGLSNFHGDPRQMVQVFSNLIENALKYGSRENSQITLTAKLVQYDARLRKSVIRFDVQDQGEGIEPVEIPRLTERFYRIDEHRNRGHGGTGLGLAIVKHIIRRHRGELRIKSERGEGSTFSVFIPLTG